MYRVVIDYGGTVTESRYRAERQAMKRWSAWYAHGLDMVGQVASTFCVFNADGVCVFCDRF